VLAVNLESGFFYHEEHEGRKGSKIGIVVGGITGERLSCARFGFSEISPGFSDGTVDHRWSLLMSSEESGPNIPPDLAFVLFVPFVVKNPDFIDHKATQIGLDQSGPQPEESRHVRFKAFRTKGATR